MAALEWIILVCLGTLLSGATLLAVKILPAERWQIFASLPRKMQEDGSWKGLNLTYYGFFSAWAYLFAAIWYLVLMAAQGAPPLQSACLLMAILGCCVPAASLVARWVDRKRFVFSVGGASFIGVLIAPLAVMLVNFFSPAEHQLPYVSSIGALVIGYALGEALGRYACLSFGCCYGKPVEEAPRWLQPLFRRWSCTFEGATKKASYASQYQGRPLVPIQGMTALLFSITAVVASGFYLAGHFALAMSMTFVVTQLWRFVSEFLRADHRGTGQITKFQWMALFNAVYAGGGAWLLPTSQVADVSLFAGLQSLWNPIVILALQALWLAIFIHTGTSRVTAATLHFHVQEGRI